jgi:hypothetical protein
LSLPADGKVSYSFKVVPELKYSLLNFSTIKILAFNIHFQPNGYVECNRDKIAEFETQLVGKLEIIYPQKSGIPKQEYSKLSGSKRIFIRSIKGSSLSKLMVLLYGTKYFVLNQNNLNLLKLKVINLTSTLFKINFYHRHLMEILLKLTVPSKPSFQNKKD